MRKKLKKEVRIKERNNCSFWRQFQKNRRLVMANRAVTPIGRLSQFGGKLVYVSFDDCERPRQPFTTTILRVYEDRIEFGGGNGKFDIRVIFDTLTEKSFKAKLTRLGGVMNVEVLSDMGKRRW